MTEYFGYKSPKKIEVKPKGDPESEMQQEKSNANTKRIHPCISNLKEFFGNTGLHGFRYVLDKKYTLSERIWWAVMIVSSVVVCAFLIRKVWLKWEQNPVIVSFAETSNSAWHIPFPAVTICTETKPRQRIFNFTKASRERWSEPPTISDEDLKIYYDMLLLCNNELSDGPDFADVSSIETLKRLAPTQEEVFLACLWDHLSCKQMFSHTLTKDGYCFTFNMLSAEEMFRLENLHKDYYHVAGNNRSAWTLGRGYPPDASIQTYPLRGLSYGTEEFEVILLTDTRDMDQECRGPVQGFKVWLHNPAELPNMGQNFFRLPIQFQSAAAIKPRVVDTSEGLRHYPPNKRQCYFAHERYLRFYRLYTQRNCELECLSNYTALRCGCVPLYMPHELSVLKSSLNNLPDDEDQCDCLQACTELKYDVEVTQAVYDLTTYRRHPNEDIAKGWRQPSGLVLYFSEDLFTSLRRSELYGGVDFLANCGGIMGLFMGFSLLSLVEIVYYATIRLWCQLRRSAVVTDT